MKPLTTSLLVATFMLANFLTSSAADFPQSFNVEPQPLKAQVKRVTDAMDYLGFPLADADRKELDAAFAEEHQPTAREGIQNVPDRNTIVSDEGYELFSNPPG